MSEDIEKDVTVDETKDSFPDLKKLKDDLGSQRVFKKSSPNSVLTLYLGTRDVICRRGVVEPLRGVIFLDPKFVPNHKIFGQLTLTFRYGREDEEVMGLKFCNEAIIALKQIWPRTQETEELSQLQGPEGSVDKPFLWTDGRVSLRAALNKSAYGHGEHISVTIDVRNNSRKIIRKIRIFAVQHVDVCMFSNGKFKNVVADINENHEIRPGELHRKVYSLLPIKGPTKNWIAVEGSPSHSGTTDSIPLVNYSYKIASSAPRGPQLTDERNVFAIYVSYYIKVKLALSGMGGEVTLKLPFILGHIDDGSVDNQDRNDVTKKKFDKKIEEGEVASGNDDDVDGDGGGNVESKINVESTDIGDVNAYSKNCIDSGSESGAANGIKTIAKCRNENGLSIDVIVEDLSDQKIETNSGDGLEASPRKRMSSSTNCNETERNINVVTAQIHSSAV